MDKVNYVTGFNDGYIIRKYHPLLIKKLVHGSIGGSTYFKGFKAGVKQYEKEVEVQVKEYLDKRKEHKDKSRNTDKGRKP